MKKKFQVVEFYSLQRHYSQKSRVFILITNKKFYTECIFSSNCYIFFGTHIAWFEGSCYRVHPQDLDNATTKVSLPHWAANDCCGLWSIIQSRKTQHEMLLPKFYRILFVANSTIYSFPFCVSQQRFYLRKLEKEKI